MSSRHRVHLAVIGIAWAGLVLWLGVIFVGGAVGRCLGGPGSGEAIAACHEAARYAAWGPLASPLSWAIAIAAGWLAIAAIDARRHRRQAGDR